MTVSAMCVGHALVFPRPFARALTVRAAQDLTGTAAADFSRIRRVKLDRFTIDRLMMILSRLGQKVEIEVSFAEKKA